MRHALPLLVAALGLAGPALARPEGITGYSGRSGTTCNACHGGGTTPTVVLTGPARVEPGSTHTYRLTLTGGAGRVAGFDVAVEGAGATLVPGDGQRAAAGELTHSSPRAFTDGAAVFEFSLRAPAEARGLRLFAAGNSANGDGSTSGDRAATTTLAIQMTGADGGVVDPPDAGPGDTPDDPGPVLREEPTGGCDAAGGLALPAGLFLATMLLRLRRRWGARRGPG